MQTYQLDDKIVQLLELTTQDLLRDRLAPMRGQPQSEENKQKIEMATRLLLQQLFWSVVIWPRFSDETTGVVGEA